MENYLHCDPQLNTKFCSMFRLMEQCSINRLTLETFAQQLSNTFHYVRSDYFRRLIIQNDHEYCCSIKKQKQTWVFFRFVRIPYIDQVNQDRHLLPLFMFIRKNFNLIRAATLEDCNFEFNVNIDFFQQYCHPIIDCLDFLKRFFMMIIHDDVHDSNPENSNCFFILKEMRKLLLFIGRLSQFETKFQEFSFHRKSDADGCFYHHFHLTLQIWLTYLEMLYALKRQSNKFYHRIFSEFNLLLNNDQANDDLFIQCLRLFLYDILCFSLERFQQNIQNDNDYSCYIQPDSTFTPFICTCFQETILLLKFMLNNNNNNSNDDQFQSIFFNVLAYFDSKNQDKIIITDPEEIQIDHFRSISLAKYFVKEFNQYSLWLWSNMVPLLAIDLNLTYKEIRFDLPANILKIYRTIFREIDCQYPSIKSTNLLGKCRLIPSLIICAIRYGCFISDPSIDLVILFMDFFLKRYNYKFSLQSNVNLIDNDMIMTIKDGQKWSEKIQEIIESSEDIYQNNDCFKIFLFYFHQQMKKIQQQQLQTNRMKNQQIERITMMNYQKIVSKIVVTLQPNFIRSIQPNGFYRIGQLYLILIESLPTERWLEHNDRLLNPIRELLKEKRTIDFQEILLKFYFAILHLKSATTVEQNHKIVSILNRYMNGILLENIRLIDPKKDFLKIINNYFNELNNLLTKSFQQFFHYYYDDLIGKIELIKMYQQFLSFETDRSDRLIVMEFFKKLLNIFYDKIIVKRQQQQIDEHQSSSPTDNIVNIDNDNLLSSSFDNIIQSLIELLIEMIKLELIASQNDDDDKDEEDEPDEIVAYITLKITIINMIMMNNNNNNRQHQCLNIIDLFLSFQGQDSQHHHHHGKCSNTIDIFHLNYLYLLFKDNYLKDIFESIDNQDNLVKKIVSIWSKLLIIIDDNDQNDCDTDQRKYEKLLIISRRIYRWFESESIVLLDNGIIFEKFLSILYDRFGLVTSNSERIKHMNNVDQYFRPMIIKSQQILLTISRRYNAMTKNIHFINLPPKDVRLLIRIYRSIAELISRLSQQIYIVGKSDCLLVTILENIIILPSNCQFLLQIKSLWPSLFRQSFPMIFEGLVQLDPNDPYLNRKIRQLILIYLPIFSQYLNYTAIKTLISNRGSKVYENWHLQIILILKSTFLLVQREQTITKDLYEYLNQFCRLNHISHKDLLRLSEQIFRTNITEFKIGQHQQQTDYRMALFQTIISCLIESFKKSRSNIGDDGKEDQEEVKIFIEQVISPFIKANAQTRPAKLFEVIKFLLPTKANSQCPILFHEFCLEINRQMDYFERISLGANQLILRNLLREFLSHYENKT